MKLATHEHYESVSALWDEALKPIPTSDETNWKLQNAVGRHGGADWFGLDYNDVLATRVSGWNNGANRVKKFAESLKATILAPKSIRRKIRWDDQGDSLDITRVWTGQLDKAWESHPRQAHSGQQTVTLFAQLWQHAGSSTESFFWRGAATLALADLLTEAGYNVAILGGSLTTKVLGKDSDIVRAFTCTIKDATAPLDISSLAATICLSGFCRVAIFKLFTRFAHRVGKVAWNCFGRLLHGNAVDYEKAQKALRDDFGFSWDFDSTFVTTEQEAKAWVLASLAELEARG